MKFQLLLALILTLSLCGVVWSDDASSDAKKMEGTWLMTSGELAGGPFPENFVKTTKLEVKDGKYTVTVGAGLDKGTLKLDPSAKPKTMDIVSTEGGNKGKTFLAIYELDGDTLKICYDLGGEKRPSEFKTAPNTKQFLATYKRQ